MTTFVLADDGHGAASLWVREPDGYMRAIVSVLDLPPDSRKYWPEIVERMTRGSACGCGHPLCLICGDGS